MSHSILPAAGLLALAVCLAGIPGESHGCAPAPHEGQRVDVADETALVIWDEAARTQHFVRRATFVGTGYDFGFLVPTPNKPQLEEADGGIFDDLAKITAPKTEYREESGLNLGCGMFKMGAKLGEAGADGGAVVVLEQKRVGDLDAAVLGFRPGAGLAPEDAAVELLAWLNRNQYAVRPDLIDWLKPYARDGWVITAFKIAGQPAEQAGPRRGSAKDNGAREGNGKVGLKSAAVRMSFKSDRPFFPYREPADQRDEEAKGVHRLLRVYVAAAQRMAGKLGDGTTRWPATTAWADAVTDEERLGLLAKAGKDGKLPADTTAPGRWWVTEFEDRSSPRPGTDEIYFEPSADQSIVARRPYVVTNYHNPWWLVPVCVGVPIVFLAAL